VIRHQIDLGVDAIKLYIGLGANELRVGCEEAHSEGKKVLAHLGLASASEAARAGVDEIMHLTGCKPAWEKRPGKSTEALGRVFLRKGTVLNSTFLVWDRLARPLSLEFVYDGRRKWLSPAYQDLWHSEETGNRIMVKRMNEQRSFILMKEFLAAMHEMGVPIIAGSDAPFPHLIPGFSLHDELVAIADIGLSPLEVLRMATSRSAEALGINNNIGKLAKGMFADIAVFEGDPTEDLTCLGETRMTVHRGYHLESGELFNRIRSLFTEEDDSPVTRLMGEFVKR
jgi:imidazolonepropionase-like amidohydrolase